MKKNLLPIAFIVFGTVAFGQVENGDFESWTELTLFEHPSMGLEAVSSNHEIFIETGETNVIQVEHDGGSAMRLENRIVGESVIPAFYILGETPRQDGEDLVFPGGLTASDQNITGVSVDLSYEFPGEASGFVIVQFKQNGVPVGPGTMGTGTFFYPISGQQGWETEVFDFGTTINAAYDQVVIGFATADLIGSDSDFPQGSWMEIDNLSLINSTDEITNGDFELWAELLPIALPAKVELEINLLSPAFEQSIDASQGEFALGLITRDFDGFAELSKAMIGSVDVEGEPATIDLKADDAALSFDYKYMAGDDLAEVVMTFYQESEGSLIPVFVKTLDLEPTETYQAVEYNFLNDLTESFVDATKMSLEFFSSKESGDPQPNSFLLLDNVAVTGTLNFFSPTFHYDPFRINAYPNPTMGRVTFDFGKDRTGFYRVYNNQGYQIASASFEEKRNVTHNLYDMPAGQYTFRFYHESGIHVARVIKN